MLASKYQAKLTKQSYTNKNIIDGVKFIPLKFHSDESGSFSELIHCNQTGLKLPLDPKFNLKQVNYSVVDPYTTKAFHLHLRQSEYWFVPPSSKLLMGLIDARQASPTQNEVMRFTLGGGKAKLLFIPAGVAHGVKNFLPNAAQIIYFVDTEFSLKDNDEHRLPWDMLGKQFWKKGKA